MKFRLFGIGRFEAALFSPKFVVTCGSLLFDLLGLRTQTRGTSLAALRRILVVRMDEIGDVVLCSPFLRELRRNCPAAWISLVVKPEVGNLVEKCPYVDEVLTFNSRATAKRFARLVIHSRALRLAANYLWRRRFEIAVNPRRDHDYYHANLLAYFSAAPRRAGYAATHLPCTRRSHVRNRFLTDEFTNDPAQHEVKHDLSVLEFLGGTIGDDSLEAWLLPDDVRVANDLLTAQGVSTGEPLLGIAPGAGAPMKMWPVGRFRELAERIHNIAGIRSVIVGSPGEVSLGNHISEGLGNRAINLTGRTTLRQTTALIKRCNAFIGNDSGPMHLAAAVRTPVVEICPFPRDGSPGHINSPERFGPWGVPAIVLQAEHALRPCSFACQAGTAHCVTQIHVDEAAAAVLHFLKPPTSELL